MLPHTEQNAREYNYTEFVYKVSLLFLPLRVTLFLILFLINEAKLKGYNLGINKWKTPDTL